MIISLGLALLLVSSGLYAGASEQPALRHAPAALQQTGFTSRTGHPDWLCAFTALVSPLPLNWLAPHFSTVQGNAAPRKRAVVNLP